MSGSNSGNKSHSGSENIAKATRINQNAPHPNYQQAQTVVKSPQEKCEDVQNELNELEKQVNEFNGNKNDKLYLRLEELLTRCLLRLDEIDRGDERVNQMRKKLINFAHELTDMLEKRARLDNDNQNGMNCNHDNLNNNNNFLFSYNKKLTFANKI
jgi:hypothetical protein